MNAQIELNKSLGSKLQPGKSYTFEITSGGEVTRYINVVPYYRKQLSSDLIRIYLRH